MIISNIGSPRCGNSQLPHAGLDNLLYYMLTPLLFRTQGTALPWFHYSFPTRCALPWFHNALSRGVHYPAWFHNAFPTGSILQCFQNAFSRGLHHPDFTMPSSWWALLLFHKAFHRGCALCTTLISQSLPQESGLPWFHSAFPKGNAMLSASILYKGTTLPWLP